MSLGIFRHSNPYQNQYQTGSWDPVNQQILMAIGEHRGPVKCYICSRTVSRVENPVKFGKVIEKDNFRVLYVICQECVLNRRSLPELPVEKVIPVERVLSTEHDPRSPRRMSPQNRIRRDIASRKVELEELEDEYSELECKIVIAKDKIEKHKRTFDRLTQENRDVLDSLRNLRSQREERKRQIAVEMEELEGQAREQKEQLQQTIIQETKKLSSIQQQKESMILSLQESLMDVGRLVGEQKRQLSSEKYICKICMEREGNISIECGHMYCNNCLEQINECSICKKVKPEEGFQARKLYFV